MGKRTSGGCGEGWEETRDIVTAKCVVCGSVYKYPKGAYEPKTCKRDECIRRFFHPEL